MILVALIMTVKLTDPFNIKRMIYPGATYKKIPSIADGKLVTIKNKNRNVYSYFVKRSEKLIVFFHGNGDTMLSFQEVGKYFADYGYSLLLVEYPGYGLASAYEKSENAIYSDCKTAISYAQKNFGFNASDTYLFGYSLGTGVAVEMAKRHLGNKLVLVSAFTSISDVAAINFIPVLPYILINDDFDSKSKAGKITMPVLLIHGKKDAFIPYRMSEMLHKKFKNSKVILIEEATHNAILYVTRKDIASEILSFL
jgi:pimeloyl-ACP methyl ester carboxylesterase